MESKLNFFDVFKFHIRMLKQDKEGYMIGVYLLNMVIAGSIPLLAVVLPRYIIDSISSSLLTDTIIFIAIFVFSSMVLSIISTKLKAISNGNFVSSRLQRSKMHNDKFKNISMKHLDNSKFHSDRAEAFSSMQYSTHGYQGTMKVIYRQLPEIFTIIGFILILGFFNPWIILVTFACAIIQFLLCLKSKQYAIKNYRNYSDYSRVKQYYYNVTHDFSYGKDIRVNKLSNPLKELYVEKSNKVLNWLKGRDLNEYKFNLFDLIFLLITNGLSYLLIIKAYSEGTITLGVVSMAVMTVLGISMKLQNTFKEIANLRELTESTKKYIAFFHREYEYDVDNGEPVNTKDMEILFDHVSFKYPFSDHFVLKNISFKVKAKEKMALVGINGGGKSTIVKLLCGFYLPTKGDIYIDGINTKSMNFPAYQKQLSVVFQEVNLYAGTILENITGPNPTQEEIQRAINALKQISLYNKVMSFKNKENTNLLKVIDLEGVEFSGGEAQKLSIARAIYKQDSKLIILDEPTAALDAIAEKEIYEHFNELITNKTSIMISHRLASTKFCDSILFLENGELLEQGNHETLMKKIDGKYRNMFTTQGKYYKEEETKDEA
ncbi:ABC transporter ATP-binding protein [Candidatus Izemoplasma sp. B36]|uniref:ABC transporter ATP-binding protein n=1 Tax=Candidatus Izemoplasma sp. B36 TaxID=3242468 RepID=UPI0035569EA5